MGSRIAADDVVVGSGPTGFAAALALIQSGRSPVVVDCSLSPAYSLPKCSGSSRLALKTDSARLGLFGYPRTLVTSADGRQLPLSSARGGLGTIWGAGILARHATEIRELLPVMPGIEDAYSALFAALPVAGQADDLSRRFPWPVGTAATPQSKRCAEFVATMKGASDDVIVGAPRVALDVKRCIHLGSCLTGCPLGLFFSPAAALNRLASEERCRLVDGPVIEIRRDAKGLVLLLPSRELSANRVFLAAGPIGTPALLQRSDLAPRTLRVADSAVFYMGFLNHRSVEGDEGKYAQAQAIIFSAEAGQRDFQLSLYESNDYYFDTVASISSQLASAARPLRPLAGRFNAGIGFLDSSVSGELVLHYSNGRTYVVRGRAKVRQHATEVLTRVRRALKGSGISPVPGAVLIPPVGCGYHSGSGLPMGSEVVGFHGELKAEPRVHVVDATALPKIWAGSHTFTAMANAYRIARLDG